MDTFWQDLRHGIRLAASRPGFTAVAAITLALGIGPNTAIFSVVNSLLLTPPPFDEPGRIVTTAQVQAGQQRSGPRPAMPSTDDIQDWRAETRTLERIALYAPDSLTLTGYGDAMRLSGSRVSPALFPLLRVKPMVGRTFEDDEEKPGSAPVVLVSHRLWEQKLGADPAIVGKHIVLDGSPREVIGIMPADFAFPSRDAEYWVPFVLAPPERNPNERRIAVVPFIARLRPGVSVEAAASEGNAIIARNDAFYRGGVPGGESGRPSGRGGGPAGASGPAQASPGRGGAEGGQSGGAARRDEARPASDGETTRGGRGPTGAFGSGEAGPRTGSGGPGDEQVPREAAEGGRRGVAGGAGSGRGERGTPEAGNQEAVGGAPVGGGGRQGGVQRIPLRLVTLQERQSGQYRPALLVLTAAVGLVLLIACANVANLILSGSTMRVREFAVRAALGAGRARLIRQVLTEGAVLAALGGVIGLLFAYWAIRLLSQIGTPVLQRLEEVRLDVRVLAFAVLVSLFAAVLFGLAPALAVAGEDLVQSLKSRSGTLRARLRLGGPNALPGLLAIVQVALALMLAVGAALLARSLFTLLGRDLGYRPEGALTVQVQLPRARYPRVESRTAFFDQLLAAIRSMPGVEAAGATNMMPMSQAQIRIGFDMPGIVNRSASDEPVTAGVRLVSSDLFKALGTPLLAGRDFTDADQPTSEPVLIVNSAFVARYLPGIEAVGRQVDIDGLRRIVGVVESIRPQGLDSEPGPEMYFPLGQFGQLLMEDGPLSATTLVVRTAGDTAAIVPGIRSQVSRLDPQLPLFNVTTLSQRVADSVAQPRLMASLLGIFAGLALALAAVGIYGVLSSQVAQSTREIGIQMALGAGPRRIRHDVLRNAATLTGIGVTGGLAGAWLLTRYIRSMLFGITPFDATAFAVAAVSLGAVALLGAWLPTRRATMVDPVVALRQE
ncbi:MAG: ABC transporter permease [Vicinamibacterales bacterium]